MEKIIMLNRFDLKAIKSPRNRLAYYLVAGMLLGIGFLLIFLGLAEDLANIELGLLDQNIAAAVTAFRSPLMTEFMKLVSNMGSASIIISIAVPAIWFLLVIKKHYWDTAILIVALSGAYLLNLILKSVFHRSRPDLPSLVQASGYSFPSGHAMISLVFYGMLIYLIWADFQRSKKTYWLTFALAFLVLAIGISRIYLGVHYPSDVIAGYAAGGFWLTGCVLGLHTVKHRNRGRQTSAHQARIQPSID